MNGSYPFARFIPAHKPFSEGEHHTASGSPSENGMLQPYFDGLRMTSGDGVSVYLKGGIAAPIGWTGGTRQIGATLPAPYGGTTFVVGKIKWGATDTAVETITLYTPSLTDLGTLGTAKVKTFNAIDQSALNVVSYSSRSSVQTFDEIRFGATYDDVAVAVPEPSAAFLGGIGCLMLLRRRRRA